MTEKHEANWVNGTEQYANENHGKPTQDATGQSKEKPDDMGPFGSGGINGSIDVLGGRKRQRASLLKSTVAVLAVLLPLGLVHAQASSAPMAVLTSAATARKPEPAAVVRQKITLSTELLFDFDQAALRPAGLVALNELVTKLKDMDLEAVVATGYTDRIGSDPYNKRLGLRRAQAVKAYLLSKGISPENVYTESKGKNDPVTAGCNQQNSRQLIECLAPDRRVGVDVVATKKNPISPGSSHF